MERRRSKRIKIALKAERISGNEKYGVFIEDISESGIQMITAASKEHMKYSLGSKVDVRLLLTSGETIDLHCKVRWSYLRIPPERLTDCIGLEIADPPSRFIEFVHSLR